MSSGGGSYIEAWTVVDGALDEEQVFDTDVEYERWFDEVVPELAAGGCEDAAVYRIVHEHELGLECECVQYLTSHQPEWRLG